MHAEETLHKTVIRRGIMTVSSNSNFPFAEHVVSGKDLPKMQDVTVVRVGPDNEDALFTCSVSGSPSPDVKLYKQISSEEDKEYQQLQVCGSYQFTLMSSR